MKVVLQWCSRTAFELNSFRLTKLAGPLSSFAGSMTTEPDSKTCSTAKKTPSLAFPSPEVPMMSDVYIVIEDATGEMATIRRVFDNKQAANQYVNDPNQLGNLFIVQCSVESAYK